MTEENKRTKKGQFFLITTILVVITLFSINSLLQSYGKSDVSDIQDPQEPFVYHAIRSKLQENLEKRGGSPTLEEKEMNHFIEKTALERGYNVDIKSSSCITFEYKTEVYTLKDEIC